MTDLWIASANEKKRKELHEILAAAGRDLRLRLMSELRDLPDVVEDGATFADNAAIKARAVALRARGWAVGALRKGRRIAILAALLFAAVVTPTTDAVTMLFVAVPMIVLYEIGLLAAIHAERRRNREADRRLG